MLKNIDKKYITIMICIGLLTISFTHCGASSVKKQMEEQSFILKNSDINESQNITFNYSFFTFGPAYKISKVTFHEGPEKQINKINKFLNRWRLNPLIPIVFLLFKNFPNDLELCNASFTVTYDENVKNSSRYSYLTAYGKMLNDTDVPLNETIFYFNEPHSITVEGFNGFFMFIRTEIALLKPAQFMLVGGCSKITENPI